MHPWFTLAALLATSSPSGLHPGVAERRAQDDPRRTRFDTTVAMKADGSVSVNVLNGNVRVTRWDRNEVQVRATTSAPTIFDFDASSSSADFQTYTSEVTVTLFVPARARLDVETVGAAVVVDGLQAIDIHTVSGNVEVVRSSKWLRVETVSGAIRVAGYDGDLGVSSISGNVTLQQVKGAVSGESVSGAITVEGGRVARLAVGTVSGAITYQGTVDPTGRYELQSHSGTVKLELPVGAKAAITVESEGDVRTTYPDLRRLPASDADDERTSYRYVMNGGGARFHVANRSGSVTIAKQ